MRRNSFLAGLILILTVSASLPGAAQQSAPESIDITARTLARFRLGSGETRFGELIYAGGFSMRSGASVFGQLSSMRFTTPGRDFIGVADHGYWFFGRIERDEEMRPVGISDFRMRAMTDPQGLVSGDKELLDAEGLDFHEGIATVAFEREARISEYRIEGSSATGPSRHLDFVIPAYELRYNQGLETVARAGEGSPLEGARITIAERSIDPAGDIFAAILEGPQRGIFKVRRSDDFDVTDAAFLPNGDLLLLERRFSAALGVAMRLRRIDGGAVRPGALVDGPVLMEADMSHQIDNMEAMDVWRREDGALMIALMSDDNQSFIQRSLYLEFMLPGE